MTPMRFPLSGHCDALVRRVLRALPLSDYVKTRLWATTIPTPLGRMPEWPYYRGVELVLRGVASGYAGVSFPQAEGYSLLEFGVAHGASLQKLAHFRDVWVRRLGLTTPITVVGYDTFEGLPAPRTEDRGTYYATGDYRSRLDDVQATVADRFPRVRLRPGLFADTLAHDRVWLQAHPPLFVSVDCDYYSSTMDIFRALIPELLPHGAVLYFDDVGMNFYSDLTGEMRAITELNAGAFGDGIRLVEIPFAIESGEARHHKQLYRYFHLVEAERLAQRQRDPDRTAQPSRRISPL